MTINLHESAGSQPEPIRRFMAELDAECRLLLVLKRQIYDGQWELMQQDLANRLAGRPYVVKLVNRIEDDLERIEQLRAMELKYQVDLAQFLVLES